jgi:hypothetical protein
LYEKCRNQKFSVGAKLGEIIVTKFHERNFDFGFREIKKIDFCIHPNFNSTTVRTGTHAGADF